MRVGLHLFSTLALLSAPFQVVDASPKIGNKNSTKAMVMPEEPKLPVPWQKLAANMESHQHHKKKAAPKHNHTNKSHPVQHQASLHPKEDEAKLQADTEGVVVQPLPKDVAAKVETKLAVGTSAEIPARKEVPQSHTSFKPSKSSIDAMAVLHHEAERKLHKSEKKHETKKVKQNKTISSTSRPVTKQDQPKHENGLANFEKDMGVNSSVANHTETPAKVASTSKKSHKGKHHKGKKAAASKPSVNLTGDVMSMIHHEVAPEDAKASVTQPVPPHTTTTTTTTTTTQAPTFSKGLFHLREDMYLGGHPNMPKSQVTMPAAASSAKTVHSALTVAKKHHKKKFADFSVTPESATKFADPMAALHRESQTIRKTETTTTTSTESKAAPEPLKVEDSEKHSGGLARLDDDLGVNKTVAVPAEQKLDWASTKAEGGKSQQKKSSHGAKHHNKMGKATVISAKQPVKTDDKDPMSSLHNELHPDDEKPQSTVKPQAKPQESHARMETEPQVPKKPVVHESRRNSLRKLRQDIHNRP